MSREDWRYMNNVQILNDMAWCFCGHRDSLDQVYNLAMMVKGVKGDLVECGIASGSGIAAMKKACPEKKVWGYDSFAGIQMAGPNDTEQPGIGPITHDTSGDLLKSSGVTVCPRDWVESCLNGWGFKANEDFVLVEGWVQNTIPVISPKSIALLRLDMDLYDPTIFALRAFWAKMPKKSILIVDDGNLKGVVRACEDFFNEIGYTPNWVKNSLNPFYLIK